MRKNKLTVAEVLEWMHQADDLEMDEIRQAVIVKYAQLFPDWDIMYVAVPKCDPVECRNTVESVIEMLKKQYL